MIARSGLMVVLSVVCLAVVATQLPIAPVGAQNPWSWPAAEWISPADVDAPADAATGAHSYDDARTRAYADVARRVLELERLRGNGRDTYPVRAPLHSISVKKNGPLPQRRA